MKGTFGKVLELRVQRLELHRAGSMLGPLVFPEIVFAAVLVNVGPLRVELIADGLERRRVERSLVAVERPVRALVGRRPETVDRPAAVN